ncbi:hypothetical protein ACKKBF_B14475 [Auxenochlorella protothecoides x Auxenochlorella symbiontica]
MAPPLEAALLGRPGAMVEDNDSTDAYSTFMGGVERPLPGVQVTATTSSSPSTPETLFCQVYAPLTVAQAGRAVTERQLLLFCCLEKNSGGPHGTWRALRCQSIPEQHGAGGSGTISVRQTGPPMPAAAVPAAIDWGAASTAGHGEANEEDDPFNFDDLDASLDALEAERKARAPSDMSHGPPHEKSSAALDSREEAPAGASAARADQVAAPLPRPGDPDTEPATPGTVCGVQPSAQLPCFYLVCEEDGAAGQARQQGHGNSVPGPQSDSEEGPAAWEGEAWEADAVLRPGGPDAAYLRFTKVLGRCGDQCIRYGFNGQLEWPEDARPQPPSCPLCGAERVFEFQVMTPALVALDEAASWSGVASTIPISWSWMTVAVFTCSAACQPSGGDQQGCCEEWTAVALE